MKITKPNNTIERETKTLSALIKLRTRNSVGCVSGLCGTGPRTTAGLTFAHAESAVPIRISAAKIAIIIFGNPNTSMKMVDIPICTIAPTQIFAPGGATIIAPHIGHAGPAVAERSCPHFGHFAMDAMRRDYSTGASEEQLTKVTWPDCRSQISDLRLQIADLRLPYFVIDFPARSPPPEF